MFSVQQLGAFVHIIYFTHQHSIATWLFRTLDSFDEISSTTCVTTTDEYVEAARSLRTFSLLLGQLRIRDYSAAEEILCDEGIAPQHRVLNAPILTAEFLQWATDNNFDGIIDVSRRTAKVGEAVHAAFTAKQRSDELSFPRVAGPIAFRDALDEGIVQAVAIGFTNVEIAEQFNFSLQTVRNRISRILEESGARNRTHLAAMYIIPHAMNLNTPSDGNHAHANTPTSLIN